MGYKIVEKNEAWKKYKKQKSIDTAFANHRVGM